MNKERLRNKIYLQFNEYLNKKQETLDIIQQAIINFYINHKKVLMELENYFYILDN